MPLYDFRCKRCGKVIEDKLQPHETAPPLCCGEQTTRLPSHQAMVKMKGAGGYPSNLKMGRGTAPFTAGYSKPEPSWKLEA